MATYSYTSPSSMTHGRYATGITLASNEYITNVSRATVSFITTQNAYKSGGIGFCFYIDGATSSYWYYNVLSGSTSPTSTSTYPDIQSWNYTATSRSNTDTDYGRGQQLYLYITSENTGGSVSANELIFSGAISFTITTGYISKNLTISSSANGTATADKSNPIAVGDTVTLTAIPYTGYAFSSWNSSPSVTITNNQFVMPNNNLTITPVFALQTNNIMIQSVTGGNASADKSNPVTYGDTVTLTATPDYGYAFSHWVTSPSITITNNQFVMPNSDVIITPVFSNDLFDITIQSVVGGNVTTNVSNPVEVGTTVTLTLSASSGYAFFRWSTDPYVEISSNNQFTMPHSDVLIVPIFKKISNSNNAGYYNGNTWDAVTPVYYNGSAWVECELERYNGTLWDNVDTM